MRLLLRPFILAFFVVLTLLSVSCATLIQTHKSTPKIIAMGDMHGDYDVFESLMLTAELMDADGNWTGGDTIFVQTGDIPDRAPDTRKIIETLQRLERQAPLTGGKVVAMVGNHEAMNMIRDLRYVHPGEFAAFADENSEFTRNEYFTRHQAQIETAARKEDPALSSAEIRAQWDREYPLGKIEHARAWGPEGYIGKWVSGHKLVVKIHGYLFAHGGYSHEYTQFTLDEINKKGRQALIDQDRRKTSILRASLGPLWYRGNVKGRKDDPSFSKTDEINQVLQTYGATQVIIGHTRNEEGIRVSLNGRLIQIDTGASRAYGGVPSYLRIENGEFFAHTLESVRPLPVLKGE